MAIVLVCRQTAEGVINLCFLHSKLKITIDTLSHCGVGWQGKVCIGTWCKQECITLRNMRNASGVFGGLVHQSEGDDRGQNSMSGSSGSCAGGAVTLAVFVRPPGNILQRKQKKCVSWSGPGFTDAHL